MTLALDDSWVERGEMGWFASHGEKDVTFDAGCWDYFFKIRRWI